MTQSDLNAVLAALLLHGGLAFAVIRAHPGGKKSGPEVVQVDIRRPPPPPPKIEPVPPPVEPPPPPKVKEKRARPVPEAPIPNKEPPKEPPPEPPKQFFGVTEESVSPDGTGMSVAVGNTTIADPKNVAKKIEDVKPLPPAPPAAAPAPVFKPVSALEIKSEPAVDEESCRIAYPDGEARQNGIEGDTVLRVEIDERGRVHGVKVLRGIGYGLDEAAMRALKYKCRFGPARNTAGQPVPFTITYVYHWVNDR